MLKDPLAVRELLGDEPGGREHSEAAVLELLGLHLLELVGVLRLEAKRIEADVPGGVVVPQQELLVRVQGRDPPNLRAVNLRNPDSEHQNLPERLGNLLEVPNGRPRDLGVKEERGTLDLFAHKEPDEREHAHAAVGELGLAEALDLVGAGVLEEVEGIKRADRREGSRETIGEL